MNPGRLKNRIEIQEETTVRNPVTKLNEKVWAAFHKCWAEIDQPTGRNFYQAAVAHLEYVIWFNIRYKDGIKPGMRILFGASVYEIEQIKPDLQSKKSTSLQCKEVI